MVDYKKDLKSCWAQVEGGWEEGSLLGSFGQWQLCKWSAGWPGVGIKEVWYSLSIWCHEMQESDRITWAYKTIIPIFMATNATYQGYVWGSTSGGVCGLLHKCLFNLLLDT